MTVVHVRSRLRGGKVDDVVGRERSMEEVPLIWLNRRRHLRLHGKDEPRGGEAPGKFTKNANIDTADE